MKPEIEYLPDDSIDDALDLEIRDLLSTCFTKPGDEIFKERRYWREPYPHRWVIRDEHGALVSHIGVHEKHVEFDGETFSIGGICEVCVLPEYRGRGYVRLMLACINEWLSAHDFVFAMLFGQELIYASSGYMKVENLFNGGGEKGWKPSPGMICELRETQWPSGEVHLPGRGF
jgi:predicted acetyltransferase